MNTNRKDFDTIIGYESIKKELILISDALKNREKYEKLGVKSPRGILLYGDPGTGKTTMANALAKASGRRIFVCRKAKPNGAFIEEIQQIFREAEKEAPSVIILDDMDKFANADDRHRDAEEYVTVQSCIDTVRNSEVYVIATVNDMSKIPRSLYRAGRFDHVISVGNPEEADAAKIIEHYLKQKNYTAGLDPKTIARLVTGCAPAMLESLINEAGLYAGFEGAEVIEMKHFLRACLHSVHKVPNTVLDRIGEEKADLKNRKNALTQIIIHEAGHAVIREVLDPGSVTLVSAYSRREDRGGFTRYAETRITDPRRKVELEILTGLGGMAALEQKLGVSDYGASSDLNEVFCFVETLVKESGALGFGLVVSPDYRFPESQMSRADAVVVAEIERYYRKAKELLAIHSDFFDRVTQALVEKGVLMEEDIRRIRLQCQTRSGLVELSA